MRIQLLSHYRYVNRSEGRETTEERRGERSEPPSHRQGPPEGLAPEGASRSNNLIPYSVDQHLIRISISASSFRTESITITQIWKTFNFPFYLSSFISPFLALPSRSITHLKWRRERRLVIINHLLSTHMSKTHLRSFLTIRETIKEIPLRKLLTIPTISGSRGEVRPSRLTAWK